MNNADVERMFMAQLLLSLVSPIVAIAISVWGFQRTTNRERIKIFFDIQERYLLERVREGRRLIHESVAKCGVEQISSLDREVMTAVGYSLAVMDSVALACENQYLDESLVVKSLGQSLKRAVETARPYIDYTESVRGFRPYRNAERLAARIRLEEG